MNYKKIKDTLPNKLWELLTVALKDLRSVQRSNKYSIHMWCWYFV